MSALTLCAPCGPGTSLEASRYWEDCGLEPLLFGEWPLAAGVRGTLLPEVNTASDDWPCLQDVLREGSRRCGEGGLLLLTAEALPSPDLIRALIGVLADHPRPQLVLGRAWRVSVDRWTDLRRQGPGPGQAQAIAEALREEGRLDPPDAISWALLPPNTLPEPPSALSAAPASAAPWLARRAREAGWPVLDATWAAPVLRPLGADPVTPPVISPARIPWDGALSIDASAGPRLSFLLVGEPEELRRGVEDLLPTASLPWEVVVREVKGSSGMETVASAWNDALAEARGDLVWPLWQGIPRLGAAATLLRCFQPPWVDLVSTGFRIGDPFTGAGDLTRIRPGSLVLRRGWLERLGGFPPAPTPAVSLLRLSRSLIERGATPHSLPIDVWEG